MAPEQCRSMAVDHRADLYAIGVMAYEMLTGKPPFEAENPLGILIKHVQEQPPALAEARPDIEVPDEVEALVMRCLAKAPDERFQTAVELAADCAATEARLAGQFEHVVFVQGTRRPTAAIVQETPTLAGGKAPGRGRKGWWIAGAVAVVAAILGGVWASGILAPDVPEVAATATTAPPPIVEPERAPVPEAPPPAAAPMTVSLRFETDPAGAEVIRDGEVLGVTPLARVLPAGEGVGVFVLRKAGYVEREVTAPLDRDASVSVALKAVPVVRSRTAGKPAATPPPTQEPAPAKAPAKAPLDGLGRVGDLKKMEY
jgi:serine/threonine-protein kinase